jgi:hypothetical protein
VFRRIILRLIDAEDDRDVFTFGRCRDDDLLRAAVDVLARGVGVGEVSGGLENDVDAEVFPRERRRVLLGEYSDFVAVDGDRAVSSLDVALVRAVNRIVFEQVRERVRMSQVIHGDELDVGDTLLLRGAKHLPTDSSKSVDTNANSHSVLSPCG